jgi:hypothetical protein
MSSSLARKRTFRPRIGELAVRLMLVPRRFDYTSAEFSIKLTCGF